MDLSGPTVSASSLSSFLARPGARQFVKFCVVGASSAVIDFGLLNLLHYKVGLPVALALTISFFTAICNGFYWNRKWTFRAQQGKAATQYSKFVLTNSIGWILNTGITIVVLVLAGTLGFLHTQRTTPEIISLIISRQDKSEFNALTLNGAKLIATVIVTAWNFTASKLWTFKP